MKHLKQIAINILLALLYCAACIFIWEVGTNCGVDKEAHDRIPTIRDVQKMVGAFEDGKFGPETEYLWNKAICNQIAAQTTYDDAGRPK